MSFYRNILIISLAYYCLFLTEIYLKYGHCLVDDNDYEFQPSAGLPYSSEFGFQVLEQLPPLQETFTKVIDAKILSPEMELNDNAAKSTAAISLKMTNTNSSSIKIIPTIRSTPLPPTAISANNLKGLDLRPPYFNLAEKRKVEATSTCGIGVSFPELYCKLIGATSTELGARPHLNIIQGQICDYCQSEDHPPEYAVDGSERWWQSPPLSRGHQFNEVNFTIDLGQEFHVAYVFIKMANSPRPAVWVLERSKDQGKSWQPWQYFADNDANCETFFGNGVPRHIENDDDVICTTEFSNVVPLEGGEIAISLINNRPTAKNFSYAMELQEFTRATNIRLRLLRTKTLLGHLMAVTRQDSTVTRRYFYSIKDISIGGRCVCNGHADTCDKTDPNNPHKLVCRCQHDTCGPQCENCCPGFRQKPWRPSTFDNVNPCEPCNCLGHSDDCDYDIEVDRKGLSLDIYGHYRGGGVCKNCQHETVGINCHECRSGFYRPHGISLNATDVCKPCVCDSYYSTGSCSEGSGVCECKANFTGLNCQSCNKGFYDFPRCKPCECFGNGTVGEICRYQDGHCPCKYNYQGKSCHECAPGYFNFSICERCTCDRIGSIDYFCHQSTGQCNCHLNHGGPSCNRCADGYFNFPSCEYCSCETSGTVPEICDKITSRCLCKEGYTGPRCERCQIGYYGYPHCKKCECDEIGSFDGNCQHNGQCMCKTNFTSMKCDQCAAGFYEFPICKDCGCDVYGSKGPNCDDSGTCWCKSNFDGTKCEKCKGGFYNYPICEECNCHPAGVTYNFLGCGAMRDGILCQCKDRVMGHICDKCKPLYWNLKRSNPLGCEECRCDPRGVISGYRDCNPLSGQCLCKANIGGRSCHECKDGYYNLEGGNILGCTSCQCNPGGSLNNVCDKRTGQCPCLPRIEGRTCDLSSGNHYIPLLNHLRFELENGRTPQGYTRLRYAYDDTVFPNYSWRGYAIFSELQVYHTGCALGMYHPKVVVDIPNVPHGLYRLVARAVNRNPYPIEMDVTVKTFVSNLGEIGSTLDGKNISPNNDQRNNYNLDYSLNPHYQNPSMMMMANQPPRMGSQYNTIEQTYRIIIDPSSVPLAAGANRTLESYISKPSFVYASTLSPSSYRFQNVASNEITESAGSSSRSSAAPFVIDSNFAEVVFSLKNPKDTAFIDYFTLIPSEYYEAGKLQYQIQRLCQLKGGIMDDGGIISSEYCRQYAYPPLDPTIYPGLRIVYGDQSFLLDPKSEYWRNLAQMNGDFELIQNLNLTNDMVKLDPKQDEVYFDMNLDPNDYNFVINYYTPDKYSPRKLQVDFQNPQSKDKVHQGYVELNQCNNRFLCRQAILNDQGRLYSYRSQVAVPQKSQRPSSTSKISKDEIISNLQIGFKIEATDSDFNRMTPKLAIASVVAVPKQYFNLDFVKPTLLSIDNHNEKIISHYEQVGTFRFGAEMMNQTFTPEKIRTFNEINYRRIDSKMNHTMSVRLPQAGEYVIILKYYQNKYPGFVVDIDIQGNKTQYIGTFSLEYCPNKDGCYVLFKGKDNDDRWVFTLPEQFNMTIFHHSPYLFWLNSIIIMPNELYQQNKWVDDDLPIDLTSRFIDRCERVFLGEDTRNLDPFCKKAVFSLSTDFNTGAIQCDCNTQGSLSYSCNPVGGQCQCKPNVIGRTCSRCKSGYYGFPNCQRCSCPLSSCDENSGKCLCPPRVDGDKCDRCQARMYGYDPIIGCEPCDCNPSGVDPTFGTKSLDCNLLTGQCNCRPNMINRNCSACRLGYFGFPNCQRCNCDSRGVIPEFCDSYTSACFCKENTEGPRCSKCKSGTFLLESSNPKGCTNCFCFGVTQTCQNTDMYWNDVIALEGWKIRNSSKFDEEEATVFSSIDSRDERTIIIKDLERFVDSKGGVYLEAPIKYTGNKVTSYGGTFSFELFLRAEESYSDSPILPSLILKGNNMTIAHYSEIQPSPNTPFHLRIPLVETSFKHEFGTDYGNLIKIDQMYFDKLYRTVSREQLMLVLSSLQQISILVRYFSTNTETKIKNPILEIALSPNDPGAVKDENRLALNVERCLCPPNYAGTSCETCAPGYYRKYIPTNNPTGISAALMSIPFSQSICVPCQCSGHSEECEDGTGKCLNCKHHTSGDHCEICISGYYGDGRIGSSRDCQICPCPLPIQSNNFGSSCQMKDVGKRYTVITCDCKENYTGMNCERCSPGFYGQPVKEGDYCRPCKCNNNLDMNHPEPCDSVSGICLACAKNTAGPSCNLCAPNHYGNAVTGKCEKCTCNLCGSNCDPMNGHCMCHPNVRGPKCDKCAPGYWDFDSCIGCVSCNCTSAAVSSQCDTITGQCECKPGTTGRYCERCQNGYWNYGQNGCQPCKCASMGSIGVQCDIHTGQCSCLPGVAGEKCDQCDDRHILMPSQGCQPCDKCIHTVLDDIEYQIKFVGEMGMEICEISKGIFTSKRLNQLNKTVSNLRPLLRNVISETLSTSNKRRGNLADDPSGLKDTARHRNQRKIDPVKDALLSLGVHSQYIKNKADILEINAAGNEERLGNLTEDLKSTEDFVSYLHRSIYDAISKTRKVENAIRENGIRGNADALMEQAQRMMYFLNGIDFNSSEIYVRHEIDKTYDLLYKIQFLEFAPKQLDETMETLLKELSISTDKLREISNYTRIALIDTRDVHALMIEMKPHEIRQIIVDAESEKVELSPALKESEKLLDETKSAYINASKNMQKLEMLMKTSGNILIEFETIYEASMMPPSIAPSTFPTAEKDKRYIGRSSYIMMSDSDNLELLLRHSQLLDQDVSSLESIFEPAKTASDPATKAANVYQNIVELVTNASWQANAAEMNVQASDVLESLAGSASNVNKNNNESTISRQIFIDSRDTLIKAREATTKIGYSSRDASHQLNNVLAQNEDKLTELVREKEILEDNLQQTIIEENTSSEKLNATDELEVIEKVLNKANDWNKRIHTLTKQINSSMEQIKSSPNYLSSKTGDEEIKSQINQVIETLPKIDNMFTVLENRFKQLDDTNEAVDDEIESILRLIKQAQAQTEQIDLGVEVDGKQYLTLKGDEHMVEATSHTSIKGYFKTDQESALIMYVGNNDSQNTLENGETIPKKDFFAITIEYGYPRFYFNLGDGQSLIKNEKYVTDNEWHKFEAQRIGNIGKFIIKSSSAKHRNKDRGVINEPNTLNDISYSEPSQIIPSSSSKTMASVLNFNNETRIYVAGKPPGIVFPKMLENLPNFRGCLDSIELNRQPLSLWNFERASPGINACLERDWIDDGTVGNEKSNDRNEISSSQNQHFNLSSINNMAATGMMSGFKGHLAGHSFNFDGNGFTKIPKGKYNLTERSHLAFSFKTFTPKGLLFYAKGTLDHPRDYLTVEINEGLVLYHFNLGSGPTVLMANERLDDGQWHHVEVHRQGLVALLRIDGKEVSKAETPRGSTQLQIEDEIFVGGIPKALASSLSSTQTAFFKGCLENIQFGGNYIDLENRISPGISLGCSAVNSALVTFQSTSKGYVSLDVGDIKYEIRLNMRFKTGTESSLLVFSANQDRSDVFALVILNGNVVLISKNEQDTNSLSTYDTEFNDNQWHNLNAVKDDTGLYLSIDDSYNYELPAPNQYINTTSPLFIGGISPEYADVTDNFTGGTSDSSLYFTGCLSDIYINDRLLDFIRIPPVSRPKVIVGECLQPIQPLNSGTNRPPPTTTTESPFIKRQYSHNNVGARSEDLPPNLFTEKNKLFTEETSTLLSMFTTDDSGIQYLPSDIKKQFDGSCVLPIKPSDMTSTYNDNSDGYMIKGGQNSRLEYDQAPAKHRVRHEFSVTIKTSKPSGIIFYVADATHGDFIYLGIDDSGYLIYAFNTGREPCLINKSSPLISTIKPINDDKWHTVVIKRDARKGELLIDNISVGTCKAKEAARTLNINSPYYVGGIPPEFSNKINGAIVGNNLKSFEGCIRSLTLNSIPFAPPFKKINTEKCPALVENGLFFPGSNNYISINHFTVQDYLSLKAEIKPRVLDGTILSVTTLQGLFLNLQIAGGDLIFSFDLGHGPIFATFPRSRTDTFICDGHWHVIEAHVAQNIATLSIDGFFVDPTGEFKENLGLLNGELYLGGVPDKYMGNPGLKHRKPYIGCLRMLTFNGGEPFNPSKSGIVNHGGNINLNSCPST